jgi:hypothetical protein
MRDILKKDIYPVIQEEHMISNIILAGFIVALITTVSILIWREPPYDAKSTENDEL